MSMHDIHHSDHERMVFDHGRFCDTHGDAVIALQDAAYRLGRERGQQDATPKWLPIAKAPKDEGVEVLLFRPVIGLVLAYWLPDEDPSASNGAGWYGTWDGAEIDGATHYMPAPEPPDGF